MFSFRKSLTVAFSALCLSACQDRAPTPQKPPARDGLELTAEQMTGVAMARVGPGESGAGLTTDARVTAEDERTTQVYSPVSGRVTAIFAGLGDKVRAGAPLFSIVGAEDLQATADLATAEGAVVAADTAVRQAEAAETRLRALEAADGASRKDLLQAQTDLANARAAQQAAQASLALARNKLALIGGGSGPRKGAALVVRSPRDGVVIQRSLGQGQFLNSAANGASSPVFVVADLRKVWLAANLREEDAARVAVGDAMIFRPSASGAKTYSGRIAYVAPMLDPATRRIVARMEVDNASGALRPEMFGEAELKPGASRGAGVFIPERAVIFDGADARVWVRTGPRAFVARAITVGDARGGAIEVLSGLRAGEEVATDGAIFLDRAASASD